MDDIEGNFRSDSNVPVFGKKDDHRKGASGVRQLDHLNVAILDEAQYLGLLHEGYVHPAIIREDKWPITSASIVKRVGPKRL